MYATRFDTIGKANGIVKFDLDAEPETGKTKVEVGGNVKGIYELERGTFGSEAVFVPSQPGVGAEEDDGHLIFFTHDENTGYALMCLYIYTHTTCILRHSII